MGDGSQMGCCRVDFLTPKRTTIWWSPLACQLQEYTKVQPDTELLHHPSADQSKTMVFKVKKYKLLHGDINGDTVEHTIFHCPRGMISDKRHISHFENLMVVDFNRITRSYHVSHVYKWKLYKIDKEYYTRNYKQIQKKMID